MDSGDDRSVDSLPMSPDEANSNQNADIQGRTGMAPSLVGEETSHAFFCFAWEDDEWAINVIRKLESSAYGFTCDNSNHKWDPGVAKMDKIINTMSTSKKLVLLLSPDFMHSPWCTYENLRALRTHYSNTSKIVVVLLGDMDLPDFLEGIPYIDSQSRNFWQRFVAALRLGELGGEQTDCSGVDPRFSFFFFFFFFWGGTKYVRAHTLWARSPKQSCQLVRFCHILYVFLRKIRQYVFIR